MQMAVLKKTINNIYLTHLFGIRKRSKPKLTLCRKLLRNFCGQNEHEAFPNITKGYGVSSQFVSSQF